MGTTSSVPRCWSAVLGVLALVSALGGPVQRCPAGDRRPCPGTRPSTPAGRRRRPPPTSTPLTPTVPTPGPRACSTSPCSSSTRSTTSSSRGWRPAGRGCPPPPTGSSVRPGVDWVARAGPARWPAPSAPADVAYSINLAATDDADPFHIDAASVQKATAKGGDRHRRVQDAGRLRALAGVPVACPGPAGGPVVPAGPGVGLGQRQLVPRLDRPDAAGDHRAQRGLLPGQLPLVGHGPAAPVVQVRVPVRGGQRLQRDRAVGPARRPHRLEQPAAAGHPRPGHRPGRAGTTSRPTTRARPTCCPPPRPGWRWTRPGHPWTTWTSAGRSPTPWTPRP